MIALSQLMDMQNEMLIWVHKPIIWLVKTAHLHGASAGTAHRMHDSRRSIVRLQDHPELGMRNGALSRFWQAIKAPCSAC